MGTVEKVKTLKQSPSNVIDSLCSISKGKKNANQLGESEMYNF